jgi:predicted Zn-dependent protease
MSRAEAEALVAKLTKLSKADEIHINVNAGTAGDIRFANNQISTSGLVENAQLSVRSSFGPKHASVTTDELSDEALARVVSESERLARLAPDDPEAMPPLTAQQYANVDAWFDSVANLAPEDRAKAAMTALGPTRAANDLKAAGFLITRTAVNVVANGKGVFGYHPSTSANYTLTVRTADGAGSGWAAADERDWTKIDFDAVAKRAIEKARGSRGAVAIEPGRYTVILEPQAVGDLVQLLSGYLDARLADEGRSPFVKAGGGNKIGERVMDPRVTIISDPRDPQLLGQPFDGIGLPLGRQVWVENGVLQQLAYSRFWAKKTGKTATGAPSSFKMMGGSATVDALVKSTDRGILLTRLWYLREVDPRTVLYTGLTRDGTFLIENGKITRAIRNFRFNESPLFMLNNLEALGAAERLAGTERGGDVAMPAIKVKDFNFTSLSDAV